MAETTETQTTPADEPLAKLYHMSATAGVGTQEYVAINVMAVISVVLGLASALLLLGWDYPTFFYILLVIPLAGLVFAIVAISQIRNSNGTQAGIGWAIGGVLLSLVFAGLVTGHHVQVRMETAREQEAIQALARRFGQALMSGDYDTARTMFSAEFQQAWPPQAFRDQLDRVLVNESLGKLEDIRPGERVAIDDTSTGRRGVGRIVFDFEKVKGTGLLTQYEKSTGEWRIQSTELLPTRPPAGGQGR